MNVGFAGRRDGPMPAPQREKLVTWLTDNKVNNLHHAGHRGAEGEVHKICQEMGIRVELHPPLNHLYRETITRGISVLHPVLPASHLYFAIVNATECLLIAPDMEKGKTRAHWMWETTRYALRANKTVHIFWPSGLLDSVQTLAEFRTLSTRKPT